MNHKHLITGLSLALAPLLLLTLAACKPAEQPQTVVATNTAALPQAYRQVALADVNSGAAMQSRCAAEVAAFAEGIKALEAFDGQAGVENFLEPLNNVVVNSLNMSFAAGSLSAVHPDAAVREAADACTQALSGVQSDFSLSRPIYDHITAVDTSAADAGTQRFQEKLLLSFRLSGVDKDAATRARIRELNEEITAVGQEFDNNIRDAVSYLELQSVDQLAGLPADYIAAHPPGEDGLIRISTQYPDLFPFMSYSENDQLRHDLSVLYNNRAYPENDAALHQLLDLRYELAQLLGFENYAQWVTADKMVGSPQRVESFLSELSGYTADAQQREYDMLLARLQQDKPDATRVDPWQSSYLMEKVSQEQFQVDSREVRQYFNYDASRDGLFALTQELFGVQIKPWADAPVWQEEVEAFELWDEDELIGRFFLDMHPRENKFQHAAAFPFQLGITGEQTPVSGLVCNFPRGNEPMEHSQVITFLHEFGHLIHTLFAGKHHWYEVSGINTEWDFVEAPSQMLEEWVWDYDTIATFALNAEGEVMPRALLDKMVAARDFGLGMGTRRQLSLAAMSMGVYNRNPEGLDLKEFTDNISREYTLLEPLADGHFYATFGHLNGYSAIYYTYQWSLAIASDLLTRFEAEGMRNIETAGAYREKILEPGGGKPAAELVTDFLGREISFKPYADRLSGAGLPAADSN
jgi:thimet oligopeptidase